MTRTKLGLTDEQHARANRRLKLLGSAVAAVAVAFLAVYLPASLVVGFDRALELILGVVAGGACLAGAVAFFVKWAYVELAKSKPRVDDLVMCGIMVTMLGALGVFILVASIGDVIANS